MTGFGSPCGACKFLRRKCVRGCVFAPYFCHEQGATHFAAIHKVFGASNFSKLLSLLPAADRPEAASTVSYEAQARLHDPVYGCVAHIFVLQQQVLNLQAQLAALKAQVGGQNRGAPPADKEFDKMPQWHQGDRGVFFRAAPAPSVNASSTDCQRTNSQQGVGSVEEDASFAAAASLDQMQASTWRPAYHAMEELQSLYD